MGPRGPGPACLPPRTTGPPGSDGLLLPLSQAEHAGCRQEGGPGEQLGDEADPAQGQGPAEADVHLVQEGLLLQETQRLLEGGGGIRDVQADAGEGDQSCREAKESRSTPLALPSSALSPGQATPALPGVRAPSHPRALCPVAPPSPLPAVGNAYPSLRLGSCAHSGHIPLWPHSPAQPSVTAQVGTATLHLFVR